MRDEVAVETQATELLRTLIRNGCVNTGEPASGHEERSVDALEDFFAGTGLACQRYTSQPGRTSLVTRIEGRDPKNRPYVWIGDFTNDETAEPDTDLDAVMHGAIAVTPLHLDLTHDPSLALLRDLFP